MTAIIEENATTIAIIAKVKDGSLDLKKGSVDLKEKIIKISVRTEVKNQDDCNTCSPKDLKYRNTKKSNKLEIKPIRNVILIRDEKSDLEGFFNSSVSTLSVETVIKGTSETKLSSKI